MSDDVDEGSAAMRGSVANEPVAWHVKGAEYDTGCEFEYATLDREQAEAAASERCKVIPLYAAPVAIAPNWIEDQIAAEASFEESGCKRDWPDDEPETIQRITQCMAREIQRLRLTDAERDAIDYAWCSVGRDDAFSEQQSQHLRETLERLLERTK